MRPHIIFGNLLLLCLSFGCSSDNNEIQESTPIEDNLPTTELSYTIVDTGTTDFYSASSLISKPNTSDPFYGQDANYTGNSPSYTNNGDGTITDNVTGLMWSQDVGEKISFEACFSKAENSMLGGHSDWRVPTIKELYSLILFTGELRQDEVIELFLDDSYFEQPLGDDSNGERMIDGQTWSSTEYTGLTMNGDQTVFGVNFIDGRIKGYPKIMRNEEKKLFCRLVRGNPEYGKNNFIDNGDGTISDNATGLMWQKADDGNSRDWESSLEYAENLELAGHTDWRLPNAKELQSIVDYSRSPQATNSPAIDPIFDTSEILYPDGSAGHYPFYWTGTTHLDGPTPYSGAVYITFGEGLGKMNNEVLDVHGAGCQRSDPKSGNAEDYPEYFGPQGDIRYVYNYVRAVRTIE